MKEERKKMIAEILKTSFEEVLTEAINAIAIKLNEITAGFTKKLEGLEKRLERVELINSSFNLN